MSLEQPHVPERRLPPSLADKLQQRFLEAFCPDFLPRLSPPYWGHAFARSEVISSEFFSEASFLSKSLVLCLDTRPLPKPAKKFQRAVYLCPTALLSGMLRQLHWSNRRDFYVFDRSFMWMAAVLNERTHQMDEKGQYKILYFEEASAGPADPARSLAKPPGSR